jgi:hypothetical protein
MFAAIGVALALARGARAQDGMTKATAEALFSDGKRLMVAGNYVDACPKFAASQKLDPGVGTVLNLADCYEKLGRTASAWAEFRSAASAARAQGSSDREQLAADRARALESKLSYLTIVTAARAEDVRIRRDGVAVEPAMLGTAIPIDPGRHTIDALGATDRKWSVAIDVTVTASRVTVSVPDLAGAPPVLAPGAAVPASDPAKYGAAQRGVGIGLGVLGVTAAAAGSVFGLKAGSDWDAAKSHCTSFPRGCDAQAVSLAEDAHAASNASTVAFVIGGAALAGGAVLFFTAPKDPSREKGLSIRIRPAAIALSGDF